MQPDEIKISAHDVRAGSNGSFQLNNWIPDPPPARDSVHEARVREFLGHWGPTVAPEVGEAATPDFTAQCGAMLEARPRIISSIMGLYPEEFVAKMKARGIAWRATATTVAEARAAVTAGADAIVAQGAEAGGHARHRSVQVFALSRGENRSGLGWCAGKDRTGGHARQPRL